MIDKEVKEKLENIKKNNKSINYEIYANIKDYTKYIKYGKTYKEKLQIFIMLYLYKPTLEELNNWSLNQLLDYIKETDTYYSLDKRYFDKCIKLINRKESDK